MSWVDAVVRLRAERRPGVLLTLVSVRGHAPRAAGAKMVVSADATWGSIGGGNLEATAVARARALLGRMPLTSTTGGSSGATTGDGGLGIPEVLPVSLSDRAPSEHGVQCCGGEVSVLLEPLAVVPSVAVFGLGHVGLELARILARQDLDLHLVDSRAEHVAEDVLRPVTIDAVARVQVHHAPVPELVLGQVPPDTHVLLLTHDHAEDIALCDAALRCTHLATIGLIGSSAKWARFASRLAEEGHGPEALARIVTPIGVPDVRGKHPATIAVSVAADLLRRLEPARLPSVTS